MITKVKPAPAIERPWVEHYPPGVTWDINVDTTAVHEQVLAICAKTPNAIALDFLGAKTSFGSLGRSINAFAGALQTRFGVKKGTRVALLLPNTPFYVIAYYGVLRAGGTVVNCNPLYTVPELVHITGNSDADLLVTLDLKLTFEKAEALCVAGQIKTIIVCHFPEALPPLKRLAYGLAKRRDMSDIGGSRVAAQIVRMGGLLARRDAPTPVAIDAKRDVAVQQYTGGTTGAPKGAMLSHANIAAQVSQVNAWALGLFEPPSKVVAVLPFFHILSMTACLNLPLCNGAQSVMLPRFELGALISMIARTRATILLAVPTLLQALANAKNIGDKLQSLEIAVSGGASLSDEVREAFGKISPILLAEGYGLTETSPVVCCAALKVVSKPLSIGQPVPATDIRFVDLNDPTKTVPLGERGELLVKGPQVMLGYYKDDEATAAAFIDGWLRTGDVGYLDEDGYVFLVDRIKDLIICSGFNVYPRVIEDALYGHEAVEEASVIGVPDEYRGEAPVAFIKLKPGAEVTASALRTFIAARINKLEMPREIIFRDQLPRTLIGKPSKKDLREQYRAMQDAPK